MTYYPPLTCISFNYCTLFPPVSASHVQVIEEHAEEFLSEMDVKEIAERLWVLKYIPEEVKCDISNSRSQNHANSCLLGFLKAQAGERQIQDVFQVASTATGYERMNEFAKKILRKLPQGLYGCTVGT